MRIGPRNDLLRIRKIVSEFDVLTGRTKQKSHADMYPAWPLLTDYWPVVILVHIRVTNRWVLLSQVRCTKSLFSVASSG